MIKIYHSCEFAGENIKDAYIVVKNSEELRKVLNLVTLIVTPCLLILPGHVRKIIASRKKKYIFI